MKCENKGCDGKAVFFEDYRGLEYPFVVYCAYHRDDLLRSYVREKFTYDEISEEEYLKRHDLWIIEKVMDA